LCLALSLLIITAIGSAAMGAQAPAEPGCLDLIRLGISLIQSDPVRAIETLVRATQVCAKALDVGEQEKLRWRLAELTFNQANAVKDRCQRYELGEYARLYWSEYIGWYTDLSDAERRSLAEYQKRIQYAVNYLQKAVVVRGEPGQCKAGATGVRDLFSVVLEFPYDYVSVDSIKLWKDWLWRCPGWSESPARSYGEKWDQFCAGRQGDFCSDEWRDYRNFLAEWLAEKSAWRGDGKTRRPELDLSVVSIQSFEDELRKMNRVVDCAQ
jgi:hypothetical protein